ncbi:MAG TPA: tripartite tricarboxylate transporter substrate binding protein [Burkholderiales bacterium]|nr:tripartite tricarboxylate transporter substrate binding protein [Burkholderiales bacterium]
MTARIRLTPLICIFVSGVAGAQGTAPDYPNRPVRWIVPFAPSGPTDLMSRAVAEKLTQRLGQQFVVDNRSGAGGNIGAEVVARSAPDGYTLMIGHVGTHAVNVTLYPKIAFDPVRDFTPITLIATLPLALVVHPAVPAKDVKELIAYAKARPGQLNFASAGNGGPTHLTGELLKTSAGIDIVHVPYKGNAAALLDLMAGRVQIMFSNMLTAMPHVRAGKLRAIGVSSARRSPQAPELPTVAESGVPGFSSVPWYGALGPAGLPRAIVSKLNAEIARALAQPDMQERFVAQGVDLQSSTPEQFAALIQSEVVKWRKVVRDAGAKVD